jgi:hypothetical protein
MKLTIRQGLIVMTHCSMVLLSGCTSSQAAFSIPLERRTISICVDLRGFCYQESVCKKRFLGACVKKVFEEEVIDVEFKDPIKAKQLFDMNFVLKVREMPF